MNTMAPQLSLTQAGKLLEQLEVMFGDLNVRVTVSLPSDTTVSEMVPALKSKGYAAHPESSSYAEREIVVTNANT